MVRRGPEAVRAGGDVGQPERLVVGDQRAEDAPARGAGADGLLLLVGQAHREELVERPPVLGQHPQGAVLRIDEVDGLLDDPAQDHGQVQLGVEDEDGLDEAAQLGGIVDPVERLHGVPG